MAKLVRRDLVQDDVNWSPTSLLWRSEADLDRKANDAIVIHFEVGLSHELLRRGRADCEPDRRLILLSAPRKGLYAERLAKQPVPILDCSLEHRIERWV
jgi:hypothetical protein